MKRIKIINEGNVFKIKCDRSGIIQDVILCKKCVDLKEINPVTKEIICKDTKMEEIKGKKVMQK